MLQNFKGVVFDVPEDLKSIVAEIGEALQEGTTLKEAEDLPNFFEGDTNDF